MLPQLPSFSSPARAAACEALFTMVDPSWVPALVELLGSGEPDLQRFAARALGRAGSKDALRMFAEQIMPAFPDAAVPSPHSSVGKG